MWSSAIPEKASRCYSLEHMGGFFCRSLFNDGSPSKANPIDGGIAAAQTTWESEWWGCGRAMESESQLSVFLRCGGVSMGSAVWSNWFGLFPRTYRTRRRSSYSFSNGQHAQKELREKEIVVDTTVLMAASAWNLKKWMRGVSFFHVLHRSFEYWQRVQTMTYRILFADAKSNNAVPCGEFS